jgi:L-2-amino-thiazoline-4-carboxylic acid hydrolase
MSLRDRILGAESRWIMGRVMAGDFLKGVGEYLHLVAPEREDELMVAIKARAEELAEADEDMVVDKPSEGALGVGVAVLASFETLLPLFDGDERRTILYLQHVMGTVLTRPYEIALKALGGRENPLDKIDKACRAEGPFYGAGWDIDFERPEPGLFEMKVKRCFWRDFFDRHDARLVTTVMCSWDTNWMRSVDPAVMGLRAERTSLLSLGDDECRFAVLETDDPLASYTDKVEQRFVDTPESG